MAATSDAINNSFFFISVVFFIIDFKFFRRAARRRPLGSAPKGAEGKRPNGRWDFLKRKNRAHAVGVGTGGDAAQGETANAVEAQEERITSNTLGR